MKKTFWMGALVLAAMVARAATNDLTTALQRGLFEEEANRNLDAAIQAYQSVANQFDKDRKLAATAIFRLGECYRKQGNTNGAVAQFERVVREFSDQSALATLSRQNLAGLGLTSASPGSSTAKAAAAERLELESQLAALRKLPKEELYVAVQQNYSNPVLTDLMQRRAGVEQELAGQRREFGEHHLAVQRSVAQLEALNQQLASQVEGVLKGLELKREAAAKAASLPEAKGEASPSAARAELTNTETEEVKRIQALIKDSPDLINAHGLGGTTPLHEAAAAGHLVVAQFLLANGANTEAKDTQSGGRTPLHYAATAGHKAMVELLLSKQANVMATDKDGLTPLHLAAENGYRSVVESLLEHGALVNATNRYGSTPLVLAASNGFKAVMELLLAHGADINAVAGYLGNRFQSGTALCVAAQRGDYSLAEFLLAKGAAVNTVSNEGRTALSYAAENQDLPLVKLLLTAHADPNAGTLNLPLAGAAYNGTTNLLKLLLAAGANPNTNSQVTWNISIYGFRYSQGGTFNPLCLAVAKHHPEAVAELLRAKANPNSLDPQGTPVLFEALADVPTLQALLEGGADPNARNREGATPLQAVTGFNNPSHPDSVKALLAHGAEPNVANAKGWTPLHTAAANNETNIMVLLLEKGADPNAKTAPDGHTPLRVAVSQGYAQALKILLDHKADPNARDKDGTTVLSIAKSREQRLLPALPPPMPIPGANTTHGPVPAPATAASTARPVSIVALLRQYGALDDLPRLDAIELRRSAANLSVTIFHKGPHDWNHFSLLELLAVEYQFLSGNPGGENRSRENMRRMAIDNQFHLNYPDLGHVHLRRPAPDLKSWTEKTVDVGALLKSGDCSQDLPLQWGDVVEIPEADHPLNEVWSGFSAREAKTFQDCLSRQVEIVIKGHATRLTLGPQLEGVPGWLSTRAPLWLKPVLRNSNLLLASSDLAHVKVTRTDAATGQKQQWVVDCTDAYAPDFWLRNGDVIEVPEKGEGDRAAKPPAHR